MNGSEPVNVPPPPPLPGLAFWDPRGAGGEVAALVRTFGDGVEAVDLGRWFGGSVLRVVRGDGSLLVASSGQPVEPRRAPEGICGLVLPDASRAGSGVGRTAESDGRAGGTEGAPAGAPPDAPPGVEHRVPLDPRLPVIDPSALARPEEREQFVDRFCGYHAIRMLFRPGWRIADLVAFNVRERYRVIAHDPKKHKLIGRIVAKAKDHERETVASEVSALFLGALEKPVTRRKHLHVLEHVADFVRDRIEPIERERLETALAAYAEARSPRSVPLLLLRHHVDRLGIAGLRAQSYLYPDPHQLRMGPPA